MTIGSSRDEGFRRLFDAHYEYVWHSLRRLGVHDRDLEDVAHETFLEVHAKLGRYDPKRPVRPWLFAFAIRVASDYRKLARHKNELLGSVDEQRPSPSPSPEDALATEENKSILYAALDTLSLPLRGVIVMYEIDEIPMKDIAEALEIPLHTGYSRLRLAREQCASELKRKRGERP